MLLGSVAHTTTFVNQGKGISPTESRDSLIMWSRDIQEKALSPPSLGQWPPILVRRVLSWVDHNHRVTWLINPVIKLHPQKGASPVSQYQWLLNLVGLYDRVKGPHLLFQVTSWSSDHVLFEKRHVHTSARSQNSVEEMKHTETHKFLIFCSFFDFALFCYSNDINIWFTSIYTTLKISKSEKYYFDIWSANCHTFFRSSFYNKSLT